MDRNINPMSENFVNVKREPESLKPQSPVHQRLLSLKPPRDLALAAYQNVNPNALKKNKLVIPNLNVKRNKPSENNTTRNEIREHVKGNLPEKNEQGKQRPKKNLVQLDQGVFAQGIPGQKNGERERQGCEGGLHEKSSQILRKSVLNMKPFSKEDKIADEDTMKELLREDFIDDPSLEPDYRHAPILLTTEYSVLTKKGAEPKSNMKIKKCLTAKDAFESGATSNTDFIYFQIPTTFPSLKIGEETKENSEGLSQENSQATASSEQPANKKKDETTMTEKCPLSALPGGKIGKLQILKSGRARLVFGDVRMWVELGIPSTCKQDVVSVELDKEKMSGNMYELGSVSARLVVIPDLKSLLAVPKLVPDNILTTKPVLE